MLWAPFWGAQCGHRATAAAAAGCFTCRHLHVRLGFPPWTPFPSCRMDHYLFGRDIQVCVVCVRACVHACLLRTRRVSCRRVWGVGLGQWGWGGGHERVPVCSAWGGACRGGMRLQHTQAVGLPALPCRALPYAGTSVRVLSHACQDTAVRCGALLSQKKQPAARTYSCMSLLVPMLAPKLPLPPCNPRHAAPPPAIRQETPLFSLPCGTGGAGRRHHCGAP